MKLYNILIFLILISSCNTGDFNEAEAIKIVVLTQNDLEQYEELRREISKDLIEIRKIALTQSNAYDTTYLSTNSQYLYKIDHDRYEPLINKLESRKIFIDRINTNWNGTIEFRIKETTDMRNLPHFSYIHALVCNSESKYSPPYSGHVEVIKDSTINENLNYIVYKAEVGH